MAVKASPVFLRPPCHRGTGGRAASGTVSPISAEAFRSERESVALHGHRLLCSSTQASLARSGISAGNFLGEGEIRPSCCPISASSGGDCPAMHGSSLYWEHDLASAFMKFRGTKIASCFRAARKQSQGPGMNAIGSVPQATPYCVQRRAAGQKGRCVRKSGKATDCHPAHEVSLTCPETLLAALRYGPRRGKKRDGASGYVL